jgi:NhaA family Na+:H+ antiporter
MKDPKFLHRPVFRKFESLGELLLKPVYTFASLQVSGGLLILIMTAVALVWANSSLGQIYEGLLRTNLMVGIHRLALEKPLHFWINEGLMTIFFFVVGLEIKREILIGELASWKKAALPVVAAVGGMVVPAAIYYLLNPAGIAARGWAIPAATDIAFAIGALTVIGHRVPRSLRIFVAALAIADDLGAVLIIALFYSAEISVFNLAITALLFLVLIGMNLLGYRRPLPYVILGCMIWLQIYHSGIHPTVAGILIALTIPARSRIDTDTFVQVASKLLDKFRCAGECGHSVYTNSEHQDAIQRIERMCLAVEPPLLRIERLLSPWVVFGIVPVFALSNAGVQVQLGSLSHDFLSYPSMGIFLGLVVGKQLGIFATSWLAARAGIVELPQGASWAQLYGCAILCGIGFTMSIFIADLAFEGTEFLNSAKLSILMASVVSIVLGMTILVLSYRLKYVREFKCSAEPR